MSRLHLRLLFGLLVGACLGGLGGVGCASAPTTEAVAWPKADPLPTAPPEKLNRSAPTSLLRRGDDGFLYAVGGVPEDVEVGTPFLGRYSGEWPFDNTPRPPLATGRVLRTFGNDVALVHLTYHMPNADIEGLEITWDASALSEPIGKGVFEVAEVSGEPVDRVTLDLADKPGAESGDVFALLRDGRTASSSEQLQLSRRLRGICRVDEASDASASCRLLGSVRPRGASHAPQAGDQALFLEHRLNKKPRTAAIDLATVEGGDGEIRAKLVEALQSVLRTREQPNTNLHRLDASFDATRSDFHRTSDDVDFRGGAQVLVGASIRTRKGTPRLIVNYTGVGPAVGPGLVAAPPTGGVDLGPVSEITVEDLKPFASVIWASVLVHRGQNHRALLHVHNLLFDADLEGPLRWHMRDQYAMEWGAFGYHEESLWLVRQDEAIARRRGNRRARLNALGTRVRLYDFLDLPTRAVDTAKTYLDAYEADAPETSRLGALGMYAEMLVKHERYDDARKVVEQLQSLCPNGCSDDLAAYLTSISWVTPAQKAPDLHDMILDRVVQLTERTRGRSLAAARLLQGLHYLERDNLDQGLIAFLESARLYEKAGDLVGLARSKHFVMLTQLERDNFKNAVRAGREELELRRKLRDFEGLGRAYERLANAFSSRDARKNPRLFLRAAQGVLSRGYRIQRARGDFAKASKSLFVFASFLQRFGKSDQASALFKRAVAFALSSTRFDIAALSHLYLGLIAKRNNNMNTFQREVRRAKLMAKLADDPRVQKTIERALEPKSNKQRKPPTQLL